MLIRNCDIGWRSKGLAQGQKGPVGQQEGTGPERSRCPAKTCRPMRGRSRCGAVRSLGPSSAAFALAESRPAGPRTTLAALLDLTVHLRPWEKPTEDGCMGHGVLQGWVPGTDCGVGGRGGGNPPGPASQTASQPSAAALRTAGWGCPARSIGPAGLEQGSAASMGHWPPMHATPNWLSCPSPTGNTLRGCRHPLLASPSSVPATCASTGPWGPPPVLPSTQQPRHRPDPIGVARGRAALDTC